MQGPPPALVATIRAIDRVALYTGRIVSWMILPMVGSLVYEVVARFVFARPTIWAYDMTFMLYGSFFMLGAAYTLMRKGHIRTDSFYAAWSPRRQGIIDAVCYALFFFPGLIAFLVVSWDFFYVSWQRGETIVTSPWMPPVYPFKFVLPLSVALLLVQGIAEFLKSVYAATRGEWP